MTAGPVAEAPSPTARPARGFTRREWRSLGGMTGFVLLLHVLGWGVLVFAVAPHGYRLGSTGVLGVGVGLTAYMLGVRHAFDADHIASIDNTTRKLVGEGTLVGQRRASGSPSATRRWSSLASLLLVAGVRSVADVVQDGDSAVGADPRAGRHHRRRLVPGPHRADEPRARPSASPGSSAGCARGEFDEAELERHLHNRGFLARLLGRVTRRVSKPWHLYPVGLLMGLGFDTATQVALLVLAAGSAAFVLPWYAILVLPVLFAAGMSLFDTADGVLMSRAYGWAFLKPVRKVFYNLTVTVLSVTVALVIGVLVLTGCSSSGWASSPARWRGSRPSTSASSASPSSACSCSRGRVALAVWRFGRIEQRWAARGGLNSPAVSPRRRPAPRRTPGARTARGRRAPPPGRSA